MPWRRSRDPYAIWVSEVMLQQTRVDVVKPYFERWMKRFPTIAALADASEEEVLAAWSGLGYYRRTRSLHQGARSVIADYGGNLPAASAGLAALPGFGPYTSAAVASIAFGEPIACVDGNVARVMARLVAMPGDASKPENKRRIATLAQALLDPRRPAEWNQAVMDLGATVCLPRNPKCSACPIVKHCEARRLGVQARVPRPKRRKAPTARRMEFAVVERAGKVLFVRNPASGMLSGLWSLPGGASERTLPEWVEEQAGLRIATADEWTALSYKFTHRTWDMRIHRARVVGPALSSGTTTCWVPRDKLPGLALSTAMRRALEAMPEVTA